MTSGISRGSEHRARAPSRSGERTRPTAAAGRPLCSSAGRRTSSTRTVTVRSAAPPVRSTAVLRLLSSWHATSRATFGLASKFAPTVPIGIRRSLTSSPLGSVHDAISRSSGGMAAIAATWSASASTLRPSRRRRSRVPSSSRPVASSTSASLAARSSRRRSRTSADAVVSACVDGLVAQVRRGETRLRRLPPDELEQFHRVVWLVDRNVSQQRRRSSSDRSSNRYTPPRERATSRSTSRGGRGNRPCEAPATCQTTARCQTRPGHGPEGCRARRRRTQWPPYPSAVESARPSTSSALSPSVPATSARSIPSTTGRPCGARSRARASRPGRRRSGATRRFCPSSRLPSRGSRPGSRRSCRHPGSRPRSGCPRSG